MQSQSGHHVHSPFCHVGQDIRNPSSDAQNWHSSFQTISFTKIVFSFQMGLQLRHSLHHFQIQRCESATSPCHTSQGQVPAEGVDPDGGSSRGSRGAGLSVGIASWRSNKSQAVWKMRTASVTMLNGSRCNSVLKKSRIQSLRITREAIANRRSLACSRHPGRNNADNFRATGGVSICKGVSALCSGHQRCSKRNSELLVICHIL